MTSPTERSPLIMPPVGGYQQQGQSTIAVDPDVLARTMKILAAVQQRPQPSVEPIGQATVQQALQLPNGQYVGEVEDGMPHGIGTLNYHPGHEHKSYEGAWKKGVFHGRGVLKFANDARQEGQWEDGLLHGQGREFLVDGARYEGGLAKGKYHGEGTIRWASGEVYSGSWKNGKPDGHGTYTWPNGTKYVGEWRDNKRNGQGIETYQNGDYYSGEWEANEKQGRGKRRLTVNNVYYDSEGIYRDGKLWSGIWYGGKVVDGVDVSNSCCTIL